MIPSLPRFRARYPDIEIALFMGDGYADLVEEGIDLAIRVGEPAESGLIARRIGTSRRVVAANAGLSDGARGSRTSKRPLAA